MISIQKDYTFFFFNVIYFYSIFLFLTFNSLFSYYLLLEINTILFLVILNSSNFKLKFSFLDTYNQFFFYFIVQSFCSMILIFCSIYNFFNLDIKIFSVACIFFKIGLFPFHNWLFKLGYFCDYLILYYLVTLQKIPLFFLLNLDFNNFSFLFLCFNILIGSVMIFFSFNINNLIISSSIYVTIILVLLLFYKFSYFLFFVLNYFIFIFFLLKERKILFLFNNSSKFSLILIISFLFVLGLPPLRFFFFKYNLVLFIINTCNCSFFLIFWFSGFLSFVSYLNYFFFNYFKTLNIYKICKNNLPIIIIYLVVPFYFLFLV